ncbi:hypothetical protein FACS1894172_00110 [Spirochaetia bacterium]|nr:hypothetical protein FACS1894164_06550 [Spirochaetia bacterium]GHU29298.1 hypothetical protein FACS1894172_00110 [Spirochaetia bacterium]
MSIVEYDSSNLPEISPEEWERVDKLKDEDIDCSDIPELTDFSGFTRHRERITTALRNNLDQDVFARLTQNGSKYKVQINASLRHVMETVKQQ